MAPRQGARPGATPGNRTIPFTIDDLLRDAGFCLDALQTYYMPGPKAATHMFEGVACACHKPRAEGA